ncbi:MAG: hypothetical protein ACRD4Y_14680, partial [Candidatus Acidiferrales bacterium]
FSPEHPQPTGALHSDVNWGKFESGLCPRRRNAVVGPARKMRRANICLFLGLIHFAAVARAQTPPLDAPEANPGRPSVSTPATLTPTGYLQFETGAIGATHSGEFSSAFGLTETIKFSPVHRLELLASAQPLQHSTVDGIAANQSSDVFLGAQGVVYPGEGPKPTIAVSYFRRVYSGPAPNFDLGSPANSLLVLVSADVKGFHYDANVMLNELVQDPVRRAQYGQSISISHGLPGKFSVTGEIWRFTQPFLRGNALGNLWAVGYNARKTLVLDAGFNGGLTATSTRWEFVAGFTYLLPYTLVGK